MRVTVGLARGTALWLALRKGWHCARAGTAQVNVLPIAVVSGFVEQSDRWSESGNKGKRSASPEHSLAPCPPAP
ncbi:hypothetical protein [Paenibacillus sp. BK720]|uniref:hypothetical protein n=1 Tax=Paenibacillus sp. BK720 TaxID=2587092 RepID=UPI001ABA7A51|nr:hypothetical protein [Paenibacillus sp. BK720]NIK69715.1 hypothetical protein [Paenibacillus sp. BK720]